MSAEGQKHAAELTKLEQRRKELEDALQRLARDKAEAQEVAELAQEVEQLEQLVETARSAANMEKTMTKDIQKQALTVKKSAEDQLDNFANFLRQPGETFEASYSRALDTEMGAMMLKTLDDATVLATGNPTKFDLEKARAALH